MKTIVDSETGQRLVWVGDEMPIVEVEIERGGTTKTPKPRVDWQAVDEDVFLEMVTRWRLNLVQQTRYIKRNQQILPLTLNIEFNRIGELIVLSN